MKINRLAHLSALITLLMVLLIVIYIPKVNAAGTKTWSGTDCIGVSHNCNWSDVNNWIGGIIPAAGDDVVFDNSTLTPANSPTNDISGLAVNSLSFINAGSGANTIVLGSGLLGGDLTVNTAIFQAASVTTANFIKGTLILGGNVTVTGSGNNLTLGSSSAGQANDIIKLNTYTLNFVNVVNPGSAPKVTVNDIISGSGTVTYNGAQTRFSLIGLNNYSGTTNVTASNTWLGGDVVGQQPFGTSSIVVSSAAGIKFAYTSNTTISNPIRLTGGASTVGLPISIYFANAGSGSITYNIPNITLLGNVRLSNDLLATVNLTGITTNAHCIEYLTGGTLTSTPFSGGPTACVAPSPVVPVTTTTTAPATTATPTPTVTTVTPGAPDTGIGRVAANPLLTFSSSLTAALILVIIIRRLSHDRH